MKAEYCCYRRDFNFVARTAREPMRHKDTYFLRLTDPLTGLTGIGEAALFRGLSADDRPDYEDMLAEVCRAVSSGSAMPDLTQWSSIRFALTSAMADLASGAQRTPFSSAPLRIPINGLIWIDTFDETVKAIERKINVFDVIKIKVGQLSAVEETEVLALIRRLRPDITIRLDANGAFHSADEAVDRLSLYAPYRIHSLEQPVPAGNHDLMKKVIKASPIPIALDEELIGVDVPERKDELLRSLRPAYIILKPTLCGGVEGPEEWIEAARNAGAGWWLTSALESNVGLNAIARFTSLLPTGGLCQGLGTGQIYSNNITSPLRMEGRYLVSDPEGKWQFPESLFSQHI